MTNPDNGFWKELGSTWETITPDPLIVEPWLKRRLRRQGITLRVAVIGSALGSCLGAALGIWTILAGFYGEAWFFVTRGTALLVVSVMMAIATRCLIGVLRDRTRSLAERMEFSIRRMTTVRDVIRLSLWSCGVLSVLGSIGYVIRSQFYTPPAMSPAGPLALLVFLALGLFAAHRSVAVNHMKYLYLRRVLDAQ